MEWKKTQWIIASSILFTTFIAIPVGLNKYPLQISCINEVNGDF